MNKERRKRIETIHDKFQDLFKEVEEIKEEEQTSFDNIPENLQEGENATKSASAIDELDDVITGLDDLLCALIKAQE